MPQLYGLKIIWLGSYHKFPFNWASNAVYPHVRGCLDHTHCFWLICLATSNNKESNYQWLNLQPAYCKRNILNHFNPQPAHCKRNILNRFNLQRAYCKRSRREGPGDRQSAAQSAGRKTRMGQQGCWPKGMPGQGRPVMPGPKGRRAERRHRATRGARTARHRAPPVGDTTELRSTGPHPQATPRPLQHRTPRPTSEPFPLLFSTHPRPERNDPDAPMTAIPLYENTFLS